MAALLVGGLMVPALSWAEVVFVLIVGSDLAFADFGGADSGAKRLYPAPGSEGSAKNNNAPGASHRRRTGIVERETGFEPATLSLGM